MKATRLFSFLALVALVALTLAPTAAAISNDCNEKCTPTCPCSIQCTLIFPTTCGEAGYACVDYGFASSQPILAELVQEAVPMTPATQQDLHPQAVQTEKLQAAPQTSK